MIVARSTYFPTIQQEFVKWLGDWHWDRFVTLALNDPMASEGRAFELLKEWDGRINRQAVGPQWLKRPDEAIFAFYFLEKAESNPHWHCLIRFLNFYPEMAVRQAKVIDDQSAEIWERLIPSGTVDVKSVIWQHEIAKYVVKSIDNKVNYSRFVVPDQFRQTPLVSAKPPLAKLGRLVAQKSTSLPHTASGP